MGHTQGRVVRIEVSSSDATTAAELGLFDENGAAVTLESHERLILHSVTVAMLADVGRVAIFSDDDNDNSEDAGERMLVTASETTGAVANNHHHEFGPEGVAGAIGIVPHVIAANAGQVDITGTGYIMEGETQTTRQPWRANDFGQ